MKTLPAYRNRRPQAGFTLIELMITIVVATILIAVAIPSYTSQMRKSRRTEAKSALLDLASREERYYSTNSYYTNDMKNLGYSSSAGTTLFGVSVGGNYYQVSVCMATTTSSTTTIPTSCSTADTDASNGIAYLLVAVPIGTQAKDTLCGTYTLDNTGVQGNTGNSQTSGCW
jgi:type IV pilus assembly protein PilE